MNSVTKATNLAVMASAVIVAFLVVAQAKPSPYETPQTRVMSDFTTIAATPFDVASERAYFQEPPQAPAPQLTPCTVRIVVFEKARLAQACY